MPRTPPSYLCMSWFVEMFVLFKDTVDGRRSSYPPGPVGLCESKGRIKIELFSRFKRIHVCIPVKFKPFRSLSLKFLNRIKKTRIWDICLGSFCCSCFWPLRRQCLKSILPGNCIAWLWIIFLGIPSHHICHGVANENQTSHCEGQTRWAMGRWWLAAVPWLRRS